MVALYCKILQENEQEIIKMGRGDQHYTINFPLGGNEGQRFLLLEG